MAYVVVLLATRWGSELGGINVFNTGLATGMSRILPNGSRTICYVEQLPSTDVWEQGDVELREYKATPDELVEEIVGICGGYEYGTLQGLLIVGHDVKTGQFAVDCAFDLNRRFSQHHVLSAVVSHMDYFEYGQKKGHTLAQVSDRSDAQKLTVSRADHAFAVGPLLTRP